MNLLDFVKVVAPLRNLMDSLLHNCSQRTKRVVNKATADEWNNECGTAWACAKTPLEKCVNLAQPCEEFMVVVFTGAPGLCWGAMVTQVPSGDLRAGLDPSGMSTPRVVS